MRVRILYCRGQARGRGEQAVHNMLNLSQSQPRVNSPPGLWRRVESKWGCTTVMVAGNRANWRLSSIMSLLIAPA